MNHESSVRRPVLIVVSCLTSGALDFNSQSTYHLGIQVTDESGNYDIAYVKVEVQDQNDPPILLDSIVFVPENSILDTAATSLAGRDSDRQQTVLYEIVDGNRTMWKMNMLWHDQSCHVKCASISRQLPCTRSRCVHTMMVNLDVSRSPYV